jgi:hypothetical protein
VNPAAIEDHFTIRTLPAATFAAPPAEDHERGGALSAWVLAGGALEWRSRICPLPLVEAEALELLRLHRWWKARVLPLSGGLLEQPQIYLKTMDMIDGRIAAARGR